LAVVFGRDFGRLQKALVSLGVPIGHGVHLKENGGLPPECDESGARARKKKRNLTFRVSVR
jgi:hypothetical protein